MDLVLKESAPAMRVTLFLVLPFIAAFPPPHREDARIPAAYAGAWLAAERIAEFYSGRLIHTAAIKAPLLMAPWSPGREELVAFGAKVFYVLMENSKGKKRKLNSTTTSCFWGTCLAPQKSLA